LQTKLFKNKIIKLANMAAETYLIVYKRNFGVVTSFFAEWGV